MKEKYFLGLDFGSLSVRAVVADGKGRELGEAASDYKHAVMSECLPTGEKLPHDWALQYPADYEESMAAAVRGAVEKSGVDPADIAGLGLDFTSCTILPVDEKGEPLCYSPKFTHERNAYVKLWKHHSAAPFAERITALAAERGESFLADYGGKVSSELALPKIAETFTECEEVYRSAYAFMEAGDWIVLRLTGEWTRCESMAGFKFFYDKRAGGFPSEDFLNAFIPGLKNVVRDKFRGKIVPEGAEAGRLTAEAAKKLGLPAGLPVAAANIDAIAAFPAAGQVGRGTMLAVLGTSSVYSAITDSLRAVTGICCTVEDGLAPGLSVYEAGQSAFGDVLGWCAHTLGTGEVGEEAARRGISVHQLLTERAEKLRPGESGLIALDWLNGNRSVLADYTLSGGIMGLTLATRPEEIYRAMIEALAFGARKIIENFEEQGAAVDRIVATGGIAHKNPLLMRIMATVTGKEIRVLRSAGGSALGSAIFGATACGAFGSFAEASTAMGGLAEGGYFPDNKEKPVYDKLYSLYIRLHDEFGRGTFMHELKAIKSGK